MVRRAEVVVGTVVLAAVAGLAATSQHENADSRMRKDRRIVKAAAGRLTYSVIADAWTQHKLSNPAPLDALKSTVRLPYVGASEEVRRRRHPHLRRPSLHLRRPDQQPDHEYRALPSRLLTHDRKKAYRKKAYRKKAASHWASGTAFPS